jgi:hypothetical protein
MISSMINYVFANSANYNSTLPPGGGHVTLCQTTKGNSSSSARNYCSYYTNCNNGWDWRWWVDDVTTGKQVTSKQTIGSIGYHTLSYKTLPSIGDSVRARGSTNGLLTATVLTTGTVNFDY